LDSIYWLMNIFISFPLLELDDFQIASQLDDASLAVYEDEREMIVTYVSAFVCKGNQIKIHEGQMKQSDHQDIILNTRNH